MRKETMSPRERWRAVLERRTPDRVPMDYWGTEEASANLCRHLGCDLDTAFQRLHIDKPVFVMPRYNGPPLPAGTDVWGLQFRQIDYGSGSYNEAANTPLARFESVAEIEAHYRWPNADRYDFSVVRDQVRGQDHRPICCFGSEPLLIYKWLRGDEQAYCDVFEHPDILDYCLGKMFDHAYEMARRIFETIPGQVLYSYVAEDLGGQQSLLLSRDHIHRFLLPGMNRIIALIKQNGAHVFFHSDGAIREIIPDLIAAGIEVLNPLQWRLPGMDRAGLKRDFGDQVIFHGAVDNQVTLPWGTVADVQREVADNLRILGAGGGYILAPCHNIQAVSPPENVVALYETGYDLGWTD